MIEPSDALLLNETLASFLKPPDGYHRPASDGLPSGRALAARVLAAACNTAGVTLAEASEAVGAYLAEQDPGQYPKPFPDPGKIIARTPVGRTVALIGSTPDAERAFADFQARLRHLRAMRMLPSRLAPEAHLDPADPYRNDAMFAAWASYPRGPAEPDEREKAFEFDQARKRWIAAYLEARHSQARDPAAVRSTLAIAQQALLADPGAK